MSARDRVPVVLVSGIADAPMSTVTAALQWDLPAAVAVRHEIDPRREVLIRSVSDADGLIDRILALAGAIEGGGVGTQQLMRQAVVSTAGSLGRLPLHAAERAMQIVAEVSKLLRQQYDLI